MIEEHYSKVKTISALFTSLVIGIEVSRELKNTKYRGLCSDKVSICIILLVTGIMYLWIDYGDDILSYIVDKHENNSIFLLASTLIGLSLFKMPHMVRMMA